MIFFFKSKQFNRKLNHLKNLRKIKTEIFFNSRNLKIHLKWTMQMNEFKASKKYFIKTFSQLMF